MVWLYFGILTANCVLIAKRRQKLKQEAFKKLPDHPIRSPLLPLFNKGRESYARLVSTNNENRNVGIKFVLIQVLSPLDMIDDKQKISPEIQKDAPRRIFKDGRYKGTALEKLNLNKP